ncbi:MAG: hypothetical protein A2070_03505 [Bdellovibrionales bacterium GWC1_52_8]|nr:MAG: hypothetical protein A2Z97_04895 [Bdellovibrionales bacterium GWB1_52_6]OFZ05588.1 MAG: hypothetical protein A2X97_12020 [Bdellovibrionales bacterium GWA1_52_35]OFZ32923.1 MAG: hypothetical protein A2070_03505 [Bdellovibrionales bacterium GWC1_52_8]HCM39040.1 TetR family transcriptional regulator [Bdellovibrionales bacterium]
MNRKSADKPAGYHHGDLRNALIEAGIRLLRKVDANKLSLRAVAKEAGVSHAAPYRHFPDKNTLLAAIAHQGFISLGERMEKAISEHQNEPREWLPAIGLAYFSFASQRPEHFRIMTGGYMTDPKKYEEFEWIGKRTYENLVAIVARCQKEGLLPTGNPGDAALAFWSKIHGFTLLLLSGELKFLNIDQRNASAWFRRILAA